MCTILFGLAMAFTFSCSLVDKGDSLESNIRDCTCSMFDSLGIDIKWELVMFEKDMIANNQLPDNSGMSYYKKLGELAADDQMRIESEYSIDSLPDDAGYILLGCFILEANDSSFHRGDSTIIKLFKLYSKALQADHENHPENVRELMTILSADDFEKEIYRIYALYIFYRSSKKPEPGPAAPIIRMRITAKGEIYLENQLIELDSIGSKIVQIKAGYSKEELDIYIGDLQIDQEAEREFVSNVMEELHEVNAKYTFQYYDSNN